MSTFLLVKATRDVPLIEENNGWPNCAVAEARASPSVGLFLLAMKAEQRAQWGLESLDC